MSAQQVEPPFLPRIGMYARKVRLLISVKAAGARRDDGSGAAR
jgi:hypothetical protein